MSSNPTEALGLTEQAQLLTVQELWRKAFDLLIASARVDDAATFLDDQTPGLLARGDLRLLVEAIGAVPPTKRSLASRLAVADAAVRCGTARLVELQQLVSEATLAGDTLMWWARALEVDHLAWSDAAAACDRAVECLDELRSRPNPEALVLMARGRLRRVRALGTLATCGLAALSDAEGVLHTAVMDFVRGGFDEEAALTEPLFRGVAAVMAGPGPGEGAPLESALGWLRERESYYTPWAQAGLALVVFATGDTQRLEATAATLTPSGADSAHPLATFMGALVLLARCRDAGSGPAVRELPDAIAAVTPPWLLATPGFAAFEAAAVSADSGDVSACRQYLSAGRRPGNSAPDIEARAAILDGDAAAVPAVVEAIDDLVAAGAARRGALVALRAARDCARVHLDTDAGELGARGLALLAGVSERTPFEASIAASLPTDAAPAAPVGTLVLLGPDLVVVREGRSITLPDALALLLSVLVLERAPMTVEAVTEAVWPGVDPATSRNRLNVALHRLRKTLGLDTDELVRRGPNLVEVAPDGRWSIDVWDFWEASRGETTARRRALALYGGHLLSRQLRYDDAVAAERERLRGRWVDTATCLLEEGQVDPVWISQRILELRVDDPVLLEPLAERLDTDGRFAEADSVRSLL